VDPIDFPFPPVQEASFPTEGPDFGPQIEEIFLPRAPDSKMAEELASAITEAFKNLRRDIAYPIPQFSGKKGDKPENH
jgi:hypothetical protein